jgi:hypothetical protein
MVAVDSTGSPAGPVRRLTPPSGHVSSFDVQVLSGSTKPVLLIVVRDDGEAVDGSGGTLYRVRVREDGADNPVEIPVDGLGRGAPALVGGSAPWLSWAGVREDLHLLPLDSNGVPIAQPSVEENVEDVRPLLRVKETRTSRSNEQEILVAAPNPLTPDRAARLAVLTCRR